MPYGYSSFACLVALPRERKSEQLKLSSSLIFSVCNFWKDCTTSTGSYSSNLPSELQECAEVVTTYLHTSNFFEQLHTCKVRSVNYWQHVCFFPCILKCNLYLINSVFLGGDHACCQLHSPADVQALKLMNTCPIFM